MSEPRSAQTIYAFAINSVTPTEGANAHQAVAESASVDGHNCYVNASKLVRRSTKKLRQGPGGRCNDVNNYAHLNSDITVTSEQGDVARYARHDIQSAETQASWERDLFMSGAPPLREPGHHP